MIERAEALELEGLVGQAGADPSLAEFLLALLEFMNLVVPLCEQPGFTNGFRLGMELAKRECRPRRCEHLRRQGGTCFRLQCK